MERSNVFITGIRGSTGKYLTDYIQKNHPEVTISGIVRKEEGQWIKDLYRDMTVYTCDLRDKESLRKIVEKEDIDYLFHLASFANMQECFANPRFVAENNVIGTVNLFDAIRLKGGELPKIFLASSAKVYGNVTEDKIPMKENLPFNAHDPYSASKVAQESFAQTYFECYGIPIVTSRVFGYINPGRGDLFASSWARQISEIESGKRKELAHGNLNPIRTFMDIRDIVETAWIIAHEGKPGEAYNVGSEIPFPLKDVLEIMRNKAECEIRTREDSNLMRPIDTTVHIPDTTKFKELAQWYPKYSLEKSLENLLNHYRNTF